MSVRHRLDRLAACALGAVALGSWVPDAGAQTTRLPISSEQRDTAQRVAQAGVPLSELAPDAPDSHTVQAGDTLWDISKLFLKSPWRWPELWGMNLEQIRNPHLIYPGQVLMLVKSDGRAQLKLAQAGTGTAMPTNTVKLSPRVRSSLLDNGAVASVPMHLIAPFLNEAVVFESNQLEAAPRIVATQEGRVMVTNGETAYVTGNLGDTRRFRVFRQATPLRDPTTGEVLGYEARYVSAADFVQAGQERTGQDGKPLIVPATFRVSGARLEAGIGDRLAPEPARDLSAYAPHAPGKPIDGQIVSVYGEGMNAGQNHIVALNRGTRDGLARGHVLALWRAGRTATDRTGALPTALQLPDERHGQLFVFRTFERVSYALILSVKEPVRTGDRFTQP